MDSNPPSVLDWWIAYYNIEPFGNEWRQSAGIALEVAKLRNFAVASKGGNPVEVKLEHFLPSDSDLSSPVKTEELTWDEAERQLAARAGF